MTYYIRAGATFRVADSGSIDIREILPVGTYTIDFDKQSEEFYFKIADRLTVNHKIYGDTAKTAERILSTFESRDSATGVLLAGEQGSGKTLLAKLLAHEAAKKGIPTVVINQPWHGEKFNLFVQSIEQDAVILFDEFEKTYKPEFQEAILTLLDGVYPTKKLFILTCNNTYRVNEHMKNRPGRIFYRKDFTGLGAEFIAEYCADNLNEVTHTEQIIKIASTFNEFNFDMLKALIEEMNRYGETPHEAMSLLNAKPELQSATQYTATVSKNGKTLAPQKWTGAPLSGTDIVIWLEEDDDTIAAVFGNDDTDRLIFTLNDLQSVDDGSFVFADTRGNKVSLKKRPVVKYDPRAY